jgi:subtilisin family serine protease
MDPLELIGLSTVLNISRGSPDVSIGLIDGPLDFTHPSFRNSKIRTVKESEYVACRKADSISCLHGTFVAGMLVSERGSAAPAICPDCEVILRPIFKEGLNGSDSPFPSSSPEELAEAIVEVVNAGAKIINLSLGLSSSSLVKFNELEEAYDYAFKKGVIVVAASGNQGNIGYFPIIAHPWVIPIVSCDLQGKLDPVSNLSPSIARRGLMSPGVNIMSTVPGGGHKDLSGTSFASPFVTGAIALLFSIFRKATPIQLVHSIRNISIEHRRTIFPPLCNVQKSKEFLESIVGFR